MEQKKDNNYLRSELYQLIRQDEHVFDFIQESSLDGLWYWDLENPENEWFNSRFWTVLGYNPEDMPHKSASWQNIINPDDLAVAIDNFKKHCEDPAHPYDQLVRYTHKNGSTVWIRCRGLAIRNQDGKPVRMLGAHHDITEHIQALELNGAMAEMLDTAPSSITVHDRTGKFLYANQKTFEIHDYTQEEFMTLSLRELDVPESAELIEERMKLIREKGYASFEVQHYKKDGSTFPLEVYVKMVDWKGTPAMLSVATDITLRKHYEQELIASSRQIREKEQQYRALAENFPNGALFMYDSTYEYIIAGGQGFAQVGLQTEQVVGKKVWEVFPELWDFLKPFHEAGLRGDSQYYESEYKGHIYSNQVIPLLSENPEENKAIVVVHDITEEKQNECGLIKAKERAEASEAFYRQTFDESPVGIAHVDPAGMFTKINHAFCQITGYTKDELLAMNCRDITHPDDLSAEDVFIEMVLKNEIDSFHIEKRYKHKNGQIIWISLHSNVVRDHKAQPLFVIASIADISERKKLQSEILAAKERAEQSDRLKTAFLNNISHEFRTPMNGILGFVDLFLKDDRTNEQRKHYAEIVSESCNRLLEIVTDTIEIAQVQSNIVTIEESCCSLTAMIQELIELVQSRAHEKGLTISFTSNRPDEELTINTDCRKLFRILKHLVDNAIKFTPSGRIEIVCELKTTQVNISVNDTGIGISEEMQKIIFEPFRQVEIDLCRNYGGNGIGLALVKSYAEMLGGTITLHSEVGKGTSAILSLPLKQTEQASDAGKTPAIKRAGWLGKTILVVDDEPINSEYIEALLAGKGACLLCAQNGQEAVDLCRSGQTIDLILMDLRMPIMSGYDATARIREILPGTPIIAQTSYALEKDVVRIKEYGFDDYLPKPFSPEELISTIEKHI